MVKVLLGRSIKSDLRTIPSDSVAVGRTSARTAR